MGSVCKTSRTLRVSNLGISCTKTPAACDQGAKTLDQADFAQPVSLKIDYRNDWLIIDGKIYYHGNIRNSIWIPYGISQERLLFFSVSFKKP